MSSDPKTKWRVRIALLSLFAFAAVASVGAYVVADLGKLQDNIAARESQGADLPRVRAGMNADVSEVRAEK